MKKSFTQSSASLRLPPFVNSSSDSNLVQSFSPSGIQESLRLSTAENVWRCMHLEQHREVSLSKTERRATGGCARLSELTARANQRLEGGRGEEGWRMTHSFTQAFFLSRSPRFPSDSDYKRIQERLNRVYTQGGAESLKVTLAEGKNYEFLLEAGDWLYARVNVAGQFCPLVVNTARSRGRLVAYSSRSIQEPSAALCDSRYATDRIWISDSSLRFSPASLYLSFHALEESAFSLSLQYGQKKKLSSREKWKEAGETVFNQEEWVKLFCQMTAGIREKKTKDFVEINRQVGRSQERPRTEVTQHRQETQRKWRERLEAKRQHALAQQNRTQLKELQRRAEAERAKERQALAQMHSKCLAVLWTLKAAEGLKAAFQHHRTLQLLEHMRVMAVVKIQVAFKRQGTQGDKHGLALRIAAWGFKCLGRPLAAVQSDSVRHKVAICIEKSANKARLPILCTSFYRKSEPHLVLFIQANWRFSHLRRKYHYERLLSAYNSAFAQLLLPASKKKSSKTRKAREISTNRYLTISLIVKNQLLEEYFRSARERLKEKIRAFGGEDQSRDWAKPLFRLDVSPEALTKLIEKAADLSVNART